MTSGRSQADEQWQLVLEEAIKDTLRTPEIADAARDYAVDQEVLARRLRALDPTDIESSTVEETQAWRVTLEELRSARNRTEKYDESVAAAQGALRKSRDRLVDRMVHSNLLPVARQVLNEVREGEILLTTIRRSRGGALDQALPDGFQVATIAAERVGRVMEQRRSAAIGIAGQRGSGKSTLIEHFAQPRRSVRDGRGEGRVMVSAPVQYDARDFFLHLFAELCQSILGRVPAGQVEWDDPEAPPGGRPIAYHAWGLLLRLVVLGGFLGAGYFTYRLLLDEPTLAFIREVTGQPWPRVVAPPLVYREVGICLGGALIGLGIGSFLRNVSKYSARFPAMLAHAQAPHRPLFLASALLVGVAVSITVLWVNLGSLLPESLTILTSSLVLSLLLALGVRRALVLSPMAPLSRRQNVWAVKVLPSLRSDVHEAARAYLYEIRFQQSFTSGWGGKVNASAPVGSAELSLTRGRTLARATWTLPETVANLRDLLARSARHYGGLVVGIDEVDKIEDPASARRFVDDVKAIFNVRGCHFLVSVSDDAVASFERRGLPFRDSFDSAFDEVVSIDLGGLEESSNVLSPRVIGTPLPFVALCHVVAGGLPRDVLRAARQLYEMEVPILFTEAAMMLVEVNLISKMFVVVRSGTNSDASAAVSLLGWARRASMRYAGTRELKERMRQLGSVVTQIENDAAIDDREKVSLLRLALECEAILMLALTVMEYCRGVSVPPAPSALEEGDIQELARLAEAKKNLAVHPSLALIELEGFRASHSMESVGSRDWG